MMMIGIYNIFQPCDLKGVIFQTKRHTSNWVLFASSSFSYKVKIAMLSNGLWPGAYSQLSSTLYGCLDGGSPFSSTYWVLPLAFSLLTLCPFLFGVSLDDTYYHLLIVI